MKILKQGRDCFNQKVSVLLVASDRADVTIDISVSKAYPKIAVINCVDVAQALTVYTDIVERKVPFNVYNFDVVHY